MKKKNKWGKHPKKYKLKRFYFPRLDLLSMDGLGDYSRETEEDKQSFKEQCRYMLEHYNPKDNENSIIAYMKKYKLSWRCVYNIVNNDKQV